jgi:Lsr2
LVRRTQIVLEDDLGGGPADVTVTFGIDGTWYEIDLNATNADEFRRLVATYVDAGRRVGNLPGGDGARVRSTDNNAKVIRDWASEQGMPVPARGRLPRAVIEAYDASQQASS